MATRRYGGTDDGGFTLVELLVSLAILALVAGLITQSFGAHRHALSTIERHIEAGEEVAWAQGEIRQDVEQLLARPHFVGTAPSTDFEGAPQSLEFITLLQDDQGAARVRRVRLAMSPTGDLQLASSKPDGPPRFDPPITLLHGVSAVRLRYYGSVPSTAGSPPSAAWRDRWSNAAAPPQLVSVSVDFRETDRRFWPELLVRPAATVDDGCMLDPETGDCRGRT